MLIAQRLQPYFLTHSVTVLTSNELGRVLTKPNFSRQLAKWTMKLSEYDIQYQPRTAIKVQPLTDFLTEISNPGLTDSGAIEGLQYVWQVFMDGSTRVEGSGVRILLISLSGEEMQILI